MGSSFFPETDWSMITGAGMSDPAALEELYLTYRQPVAAFMRSLMSRTDKFSVEDVTQDFLADFLGRETPSKAAQERGKFRSLLAQSARNFFLNYVRDSERQRRDPKMPNISMDAGNGDGSSWIQVPSLDVSPEEILDTAIARSLHSRTLEMIRPGWQKSYPEAKIDELAHFLDSEGSDAAYAETGKSMGLSKDQVKRRVYALRDLHSIALRKLVEHTVPKEDVDAEIRYLRSLILKYK